MKKLLTSAIRLLSSLGLSIVLMALLMILTFIGTLEQVNVGLYEVQQRYFNALFTVHWLFDTIPVPLPGVYLLLILAFVNLTLGSLIRMRKGWRHWGIAIAHIGMLVLMAGSFVTFRFAERGHLTLYEGEQGGKLESYEQWELVIAHSNPDGSVTESIVPENDFASAQKGAAVHSFVFSTLPFSLDVTHYYRNARLGQITDTGTSSPGLKPLPVAQEAGENMPGVSLLVKDTKGGSWQSDVSATSPPWMFTCENVQYAVSLRHRSWELPFSIRLDKFTRELYPGTNIPKVFASNVTKIDASGNQPIKITMNEPLRYRGYTLYQASWGPSNAGPQDRLYSSFAVVKDPAEQIPLIACCIMALGLVFQFGLKLVLYLRKESGARQ